MANKAAASAIFHIQKAIGRRNAAHAPTAAQLRQWAQAALLPGQGCEATIRLVGEREGRRLNHEFRQRDYATNVLSFVYGADENGCLQGDLVLCVPVVLAEAQAQGKEIMAHFAHLTIHGILHLQGFDHEQARETQRMEALETQLLAALGLPDPYRPLAP